ncbi:MULTISPECIES: hypothetical protein [unclassified Rhodococcus (in: high G+C Gram-positive bacteria)]|uniref:hypothetical protein n=1 Tax=unclassified Rhodococcus (in: high G+C Gram-positive bacteria) TaxID=192944 RepID=UPI000AC427FF|nr:MULTISPECIES: hypothetical protein [unclassified Rhodococcus (in: high G+C Gram-positive bacteria)]
MSGPGAARPCRAWQARWIDATPARTARCSTYWTPAVPLMPSIGGSIVPMALEQIEYLATAPDLDLDLDLD